MNHSETPVFFSIKLISIHTDLKNISLLFFSLCVILLISATTIFGQSCYPKNNFPNIAPAFSEAENVVCVWCTQVYFSSSEEILISNRNSTVFRRVNGKGPFLKMPLDLSRPHSILYNPDDKLYYLNDTNNNRIIVYSSLEHGTIEKTITTIAGIRLQKPHDIIHDQTTGWIYTINPSDPIVFRFDSTGKNESSLNLSEVLGYSRALSLVDGNVFVSGSSTGRVVEILDFDKGEYRTYQSAGKKRPADSGNWETDGLVINDVEYFQGYWYVTSYFYPKHSIPLEDYNKNKFIRFRNWQDFESGEWQDLSGSLPDGLLPYYLTPHKDGLYLGVFNHVNPGHGDTIYKLSKHCPNLSGALFLLVN